MIPTMYNTELISKSWDDFMDRLRYYVLFKAKYNDTLPIIGQCPDFDPDYAIRTVCSRPAPRLDRAFEFGILEGARALTKEVSKMPKELKSEGLYSSSLVSPPLCQIREYLLEHQLFL